MQEDRFSKLLIAVAIAGILSPLAQTAKADEVIETRRTTTFETVPVNVNPMNTTTTTTTTTKNVVVDAGVPVMTPGMVAPGTVISTTVVPMTFNDAQTILQTVDARRTEIDRAIVNARSAGTISEAQAANLRRDMDRIGAEIVELKSQSNPSISRCISLAQDLDVLGTQVRTVYTSFTFVPIIEGSHFTMINGHIIQLDDLAVRRIGLENKILDRLAAGRITYSQSIDLRSDLSAIAAREDAYRNARFKGDLSDREARELYTSFDRVATKLDDYSH